MKFRYVIEGTYEVPDDQVRATYGTTDPVECALMDLNSDPQEVISWGQNVVMSIEAVEES